jgi:hypothetical protein
LYRQARPIAEQGVAVTEAALGPADPEVAWRCDEFGRVLRELGELAEARIQSERAVAIGEATLGPDHPTVTTIRGNLNSVLQALQEATPEGPASAV